MRKSVGSLTSSSVDDSDMSSVDINVEVTSLDGKSGTKIEPKGMKVTHGSANKKKLPGEKEIKNSITRHDPFDRIQQTSDVYDEYYYKEKRSDYHTVAGSAAYNSPEKPSPSARSNKILQQYRMEPVHETLYKK